jgi:hypothetical protein
MAINQAPYVSILYFSEIFESFATRHPMLNSYYFGSQWNFGATSSPVYPYMAVQPGKVRKYISGGQGSFGKEIEFEIYFMDKLNKSDENYTDALSDTMYINDTLIGEIMTDPFYFTNNIMIKDIRSEPVFEQTVDNANGWKTMLTLEVLQPFTPCTSPQARLSNYTYDSGPEIPVPGKDIEFSLIGTFSTDDYVLSPSGNTLGYYITFSTQPPNINYNIVITEEATDITNYNNSGYPFEVYQKTLIGVWILPFTPFQPAPPDIVTWSIE